jgi:hypothetical protein
MDYKPFIEDSLLAPSLYTAKTQKALRKIYYFFYMPFTDFKEA